ncbi:MAG TPA: peptidoglycan-binding protein LysM [Gemmatimonadota bacterium]|nr:peptidoglycan-binding protein LysM [Gemmatimonadota bacterium]
MGLINFVKGAGAKLTGKEKDPTQAEEFQELRKGNVLMQHVMAHELDIENMKITYDDGIATIAGVCPTQEMREKVILAVGNVAGVAQVDDRIEVAKAEPAGFYHTVISGDTLSKLAKKHYGDAMKYPIIFAANQPMLKHPDKIYVGQVLRIPPVDEHLKM